jgi:hypothetical protein
MKVLAIEELETGMVLAEAVRNHQNQLLLEAGRKVTDKTVRVFKSWGIRRVAVRAEHAGGVEPPGKNACESLDALDEGLTARFAEVLHDPIMVEIMHAACRQLAARQTRKNSRDGRI